jgi:hypothetical protein
MSHGRNLAFEFLREIKLPFFYKILDCIVGYTYCNELDNTFVRISATCVRSGVKGEELCIKGCDLKILMEAHSLFFPTFM